MKVDLWHVRTDAVDASLARKCHDVMAPAERARHARFVFARHRHEYAVTRGLARGVLASYVRRRPDELSFQLTDHGRPILEQAGDLEFNLSNSVDLVVCAVTRRGDVGVDTEPLARAGQIVGVSDVVFTPTERQRLFELPDGSRLRRAVELWTQKEAYMKARGLGMSLPVDRFEIVHDDAAPVRLRFFPPIEDAPDRWALRTLELEAHLVSLCVQVAGEPDVEIAIRRADLGSLLDTPR